MDLEVLKELDITKAEEAGKISQKYKKDTIDILDFYSTLNLNTPYTETNSTSLNSINPYQLLPFFNTVIVDIPPLPNEVLFKKHYGMSVEDLIELERKEKVAIRLPRCYIEYKDIENDYLDPILSRRPPSTPLINLGYGLVVNNKLLEEINQTENFFKNKEDFDFGDNLTMEMGSIDPYAITSSDIISGNKPYLLDFDNNAYKQATEINFYKLNHVGYHKVNSFLKELLSTGNGRLDWAFTYSSAYASFLADPILGSLNGTHMVNYNMKEILNDLILRTSNKTLRNELLQKSKNIMSLDIGKTLTNEINMPLPITFEDSLDFDFKGAINALISLEKVVDEKNRNEIIDLTNELKNEICEAGQIVAGMRAPKKHINNVTNISTTISLLGASAGYLSTDPNVKPLLDSISLLAGGTALLTKTETIQNILEKVVKFNKNDHVLYLYNNYEKFTINPKKDKIRIIKSKKVFNDDLSKKYDYYEYIYKNIPIMRVIIDITSKMIVGNGPTFKYDDDEVPDTKILEFLTSWREEELPNELMRLQTKHGLLYGNSYFITSVVNKRNKKHITLKSVHPRSIRPIYDNNIIKMYKIIDSRGNEKVVKKDQILDFSSSKNQSFIEKYIYMLDIMYPKITHKETRPELLYDKLNKNLKISSTTVKYEKSEKALLDALNIAMFLDTKICVAIILTGLGDLNFKFNFYNKAIGYYEQAQEYMGNKVYSVIMEKLEKDLIIKILKTQELL